MTKRQVRRVGGPGGLLLCLGLAIGVWLMGGLETRVAQSGFSEIRTNQARLDNGSTWVDRRWEGELAQRLARIGDKDAADPSARRQIVDEIAALSFIEATGTPEILWPDGLRVPVLFENPVACIAVGEVFYSVAPDGTVLSGSWDSPPRIGAGWLPRIGPVGAQYPGAFPGEKLDGEAELDAISIAMSMWFHLSDSDLESLGRVVIDSTAGRDTGPLVPGARIYLERGRSVWFGRPPRMDAPGSLPEETKWANLSKALACLRSDQADCDWDWVDLRWDLAEMHLFGAGEQDSDTPDSEGAEESR